MHRLSIDRFGWLLNNRLRRIPVLGRPAPNPRPIKYSLDCEHCNNVALALKTFWLRQNSILHSPDSFVNSERNPFGNLCKVKAGNFPTFLSTSGHYNRKLCRDWWSYLKAMKRNGWNNTRNLIVSWKRHFIINLTILSLLAFVVITIILISKSRVSGTSSGFQDTQSHKSIEIKFKLIVL